VSAFFCVVLCCVVLCCVVLSCVGRGLASGRSPVEGVLSTVQIREAMMMMMMMMMMM
jgi:hypothetical protein